MRRMAEIPTAAGKLEEIVAMSCLPEADSEPTSSWVLWLDLWSQSVRHPEVASVRQKFDERWRDLICSLVVAGQEAGEFGPVDPADFAVLFSALLDGLAVQIALADPVVDASRAFELAMRFAAAQLGFPWTARRAGRGSRARSTHREVVRRPERRSGWSTAGQAVYRVLPVAPENMTRWSVARLPVRSGLACPPVFGVRPRSGSGFPDDFLEEADGARGRQCLGGQAVHDLHIVIDVVAPFQVEGAGELLDIGHVRQVGLAEPQNRE